MAAGLRLADLLAGLSILIAEGCSNAGVAERLFISRCTAEHHVQHIYAKIGASARTGAAVPALVRHASQGLGRRHPPQALSANGRAR